MPSGNAFDGRAPRAIVPTYYVSTTGSDLTGTGTATNPFATIDGARSYLRASGLLAAMTKHIQVEIGPGDYWQTAVVFTDADSGSNGWRVIYEAQNGAGTVRLLGGKLVTGWSLYSGSIYRAAVSGDFWTLYENGVRATLARTPDLVANATYPEATEPAYTAATTHGTGSWTTFEYNPADIPSTAGWVIGDVRLNQRAGGVEWWTDIQPIVAIDTTSHLFTLGNTPKYSFAELSHPPRYFVENDLSFLTAAGEFFYDRNDSHGSPGGGLHYLYYWPNSTPIASQEIVIPTTQDVVSFHGADTSHICTGLQLRNLTVQYSDFSSWFRWCNWGASGFDNPNAGAGHDFSTNAYDLEGRTWPPFQHAAISLFNTSGIYIDRCHVTNAGHNGIAAYGYNQMFRFTNSLVEHTGTNAVNIEGAWPGEGDVCGWGLIYNVKAQHMGELCIQGAGFWLTNTGHNIITHVEACNGKRDGIFLTAGGSLPQATVYTKNNTISYAYIHDVCQDSGDCGALGVYGIGSYTGGPFNTNTFNQIVIDRVTAHPDMANAAPVGVYFDENSWGQTISNVNVTNVGGGTLRELHDSGSHTETNVAWNGGFSAALVDSWNIGLLAGEFPYR